FDTSPGVLPTNVAEPVAVKDAQITLDDLDGPKATSTTSIQQETDTTQTIDLSEGILDDSGYADTEDALKVDWVEQIRSGGVWMYPLYALGFFAIVITILRIILSRRGRLAPKKMRDEVRSALANNNIEDAIVACEER